jgi:hypothetical protein
VPFSFAHNFHKKTKTQVGSNRILLNICLKGIFVFLSRQDAEVQRIISLAALRPAFGRQALREPYFLSWEMNEAH